jgi:hypothetical protein
MFFASKDHDLGEYELSGKQINLKEICSTNGIRKIFEMCVAHLVLEDVLLTSIPMAKSRRNSRKDRTWNLVNISFENLLRECVAVTKHQMNN